MSRRFLALSGLALALLSSPGFPEPGAPQADDLSLSLRRQAVQELIAAATPYRVDLGTSLLRESLTFSEPRDLSFQGGRITFSVRCQGAPFPVDQVLKPVFSVRPSGKGGYQAVVESLPLKIPGYGTIDLKDTVPPLEIESLLRQTVYLQGRPAQLDVRVRKIAILPEQIDVRASLSLAPQAPR